MWIPLEKLHCNRFDSPITVVMLLNLSWLHFEIHKCLEWRLAAKIIAQFVHIIKSGHSPITFKWQFCCWFCLQFSLEEFSAFRFRNGLKQPVVAVLLQNTMAGASVKILDYFFDINFHFMLTVMLADVTYTHTHTGQKPNRIVSVWFHFVSFRLGFIVYLFCRHSFSSLCLFSVWYTWCTCVYKLACVLVTEKNNFVAFFFKKKSNNISYTHKHNPRLWYAILKSFSVRFHCANFEWFALLLFPTVTMHTTIQCWKVYLSI